MSKPPEKKKVPWGRIAFRFAIGQHLDGRRRSDATFFARGTHAEPHYWGRGGESRWALLPGWKRALARWALVLVPLGMYRWRSVTEWALGLVLGPLAGYVVLRGWAAWRALKHHRAAVRPLHSALASDLGIPLATPPAEWLKVPEDYGTRPDAEIVVHPPDGFTGSASERETVTRAVTAKLGIEAPEATWELHRQPPRIVFRKSIPPPARVTASDILPAIKGAAEHELILGIGKKDQVTDLSLDVEVPHIGFCMTTGDGKSTAAMNVATQVLHHGGLVVILDPKLMSHMWARGLPNVAYAGTRAEIHSMLCWLAHDVTDDEGNVIYQSEQTRRKQVALASADIRGNVTADLGPRILVVAEELNVMQKMLRQHWRQIGGKGPSPAAEALEEIHFTGRQLRMHALDIGQRLSAKATSGSNSGDSRENIGAILFSNPSASTWKMLCDGHVQPPASDHKGRYQLVTRKQVRELQGALWDEEEARAFATSGVVAVPRHDMPCTVQAVIGQERVPLQGPADQPFVLRHPPVVPYPPGSVTLREAVAAGMFRSLDAARKASRRGFPPPVGDPRDRAFAYDVADLAAYCGGKRWE